MARPSKTGVRGLQKTGDRFRIDLRYRDVNGKLNRYTEDLPRGITAAAAKERARQVNNAACTGELRSERDAKVTRWQLHECLGLYVEWCKHNRPRTYDDRRSLVGLLKKHIKDVQMEDIEAQPVEDFKKTRAHEGVTPATINRAVALWKHFARHATAKNWVSEAVARRACNVALLKEPPGRVRYLSDTERTRLLAALRPDVRDIVAAALLTGMRRGEIVGMKKTAVDLEARTIHLTETKTNKARHVPIHEVLVPILKSAIERSPSEFVFANADGRPYSHRVSTVFRETVQKLGIVNLRFHDLRHDFATKLRRKGLGLDLIATLLGHTTLAMTQRYAHIGREDLQAAVQMLSLSTHASSEET